MKTKETETNEKSNLKYVGYQHTKRDLFEMKDIICNTKF